MDAELNSADDLHPLGPAGSSSRPEPPRLWTEEWVCIRLIEAFHILARTSPSIGPRGYGTGMPAYLYDADDLRAQQEKPALNVYTDRNVESEAVRQDREHRNRPSPPTAAELDRMDQALLWASRYLAHMQPSFAANLNDWARAAAAGFDLSKIVLWRTRDETASLEAKTQAAIGVKVICHGLLRDGIEVA